MGLGGRSAGVRLGAAPDGFFAVCPQNDRFGVPGRPVQSQQNSQQAGGVVMAPHPQPSRPSSSLPLLSLPLPKPVGAGGPCRSGALLPGTPSPGGPSRSRTAPSSRQVLGSPVLARGPPPNSSCTIRTNLFLLSGGRGLGGSCVYNLHSLWGAECSSAVALYSQ